MDSHIKSGKGRGMRPSIHSEIRRYEFFVALIKISIYKNVTLPKKELAKLRRAGAQVSIAKANLPSAPKALEMIYAEFLSPVLDNMPAGSKMREALASDSVMLLFFDRLSPLSKVFEKYAEEPDEEDLESNDELLSNKPKTLANIPEGSISIKEFTTFANDCGFVEGAVSVRRFSNHGRKHSIMGSRSTSSITQKDVRQIFSASQHDNVEASEAEQQKVEDDDNVSSHMELMIFSEFLEAIARLGVLKYHHSHAKGEEGGTAKEPEEELSHYECIKLAVEQVCSVV